MARYTNLVINYDAIWGMTIVNISNKGVYINPNLNKSAVNKKVLNNSKHIHFNRPKKFKNL